MVELGPASQTSEYDRINRSVAIFIKIEVARIAVIDDPLLGGRGRRSLPICRLKQRTQVAAVTEDIGFQQDRVGGRIEVADQVGIQLSREVEIEAVAASRR